MANQTRLLLQKQEARTEKETTKMKRVFLEVLPEQRRQASTIIAFMNNKGGVGKTSLSLAFGLTMARKNKNVLFWDNDGQSNLTQRLGITDNMLLERRVNVAFTLAPIAGSREPIRNLPFILDYPYFMRYRGSTGKAGHIALMAGSHDAETDANATFDKLNRNPRDYKNIFDFFKQTVDFYRNYFDYIIIDTAPALEGNILNQMSVRAADNVIVPIDALEAALGIEQLVKWIAGEASHAITGRVMPPNLLFAIVKYTKDTGNKKEARNTIDIDDRLRNNVYRAIQSVFGEYVCESGVKAKPSLKSKVTFRKTDFDAVVNELEQKLENKARPNFYTIWNIEKADELRNSLEAIAETNIAKKPVFKNPKYTL
ncbi:Iron-sulfur cluster carrier protein [uncultured archaeon]|nr:Iron-sulfur cluster carrier protein [uncultured archaeon]